MRSNIRFNEEKAVQVAGEIFRLAKSGSVSKLWLTKMLYLVDRESFAQRERPLIGGSYFSMPHGTVISEALDTMSLGDDGEWTIWVRFFQSPDSRTVLMVQSPEDDLLSTRERRIIGRVFEQFGHMTPAEIRRFTHTLPEYEDPEGSSIPIALERMLDVVGHTGEEAKQIARDCRGVQFLLDNC